MKAVLLFLSTFVAITMLTSFAVGAEKKNTKDSLETVKTNVTDKKAVLVDVREKKEWDDGHIEGSISTIECAEKGLEQ
jgi:hypothetical protein